jgi:hypothetical protein
MPEISKKEIKTDLIGGGYSNKKQQEETDKHMINSPF